MKDEKAKKEKILKEVYMETLEKKKVAFENFEKWNKINRGTLKRSKAILDKLFQRIDENLQFSKKRFELVVEFFRKVNFNMSKSIDFSKNLKFFQIANLAKNGKDVIINEKFSKCVDSFEKDFEEFYENFSMIERKIENQIIQKILREKLFTVEKELLIESKKIFEINKKIQKISLDTNSFYKKFLNALKISMAKNSKGLNAEVNIFDDLINFTSHISNIIKLLSQFSSQFFDFHQKAVDLEKHRNNAIKDSLLNIMEILSGYFGEEKIKVFRESRELLVSFDLDDFAKESFDIFQLLNEDDKNFVLQKAEMDSISILAVKNCLRNCLVLEQDEMLKSFYSYRFLGKIRSGYFSKKATDLAIFLTLDFNYSLYAMKDNNIYEYLLNIPMQHVSLKTNFRKCLMEFSFGEKGWFFNSTKKFEISLTKDEIEIWNLIHAKNCAILNADDTKTVFTSDEKYTDLSISDNSSNNDNKNKDDVKDRNDSIDVGLLVPGENNFIRKFDEQENFYENDKDPNFIHEHDHNYDLGENGDKLDDFNQVGSEDDPKDYHLVENENEQTNSDTVDNNQKEINPVKNGDDEKIDVLQNNV